MRSFEMRLYENWIASNVEPYLADNNCTLFTRLMQETFPELRRIEGAVKHKWHPCAYHEWLETKDGTIIDPTRSQFDNVFGDEWEYIRE